MMSSQDGKMKGKIIRIGLFSLAVAVGVFFLINYSHHDVTKIAEIKTNSVNSTVVKKCPMFMGWWDTTIKGTNKCVEKFYTIEKRKPANGYSENIDAKIFGTIKSMVVSASTTLYLDSGSYVIENTSIPIYVGKLVEIDQITKSPKECIPDIIYYVNDTSSQNETIGAQGSDALKIINDSSYADFTYKDGTDWQVQQDCPPRTVYEVIK